MSRDGYNALMPDRPLLRSLLVLALAVCPASGHAVTLAERAAAIDAPSRGPEIALDAPLQVGRAAIAPAAGTRVRTLLADGVACGLAVEGPARLTYRVEDPFSVPVAERNARRISALRVTPTGPETEIDEIVKDWVRSAGEIRPGVSLYLADRLAVYDERDVGDLWRRYGKGPLVLHALRLELQRQKGSAAEGDRHFIAFLRTYVERHRYAWATTRVLVETLNQVAGGDWQPWFERYVYGTEIPRLPK